MNPMAREQVLQDIIYQGLQIHGGGREALIPLLADINRRFGFVPTEALGAIRRALKDPVHGVFLGDSQVFAVASFYHMFSLRQMGRHIIRYCASAPCHVAGARQVLSSLHTCLGISAGQTTSDGQFSLLATSCMGICAVGPAFIIDDTVYGNLTPERVHEILGRYA
jgi:NADH:ubiquinone oxidoreductase subunit E